MEDTHSCPTQTTLCLNNYGSFDCKPFPFCAPGHRFNIEARYCQGIFFPNIINLGHVPRTSHNDDKVSEIICGFGGGGICGNLLIY